jgi:hypothetical protein
MSSNAKLCQSNRISMRIENEINKIIKQPEIDYVKLLGPFDKNIKSDFNRLDLRKKSFKDTDYLKEIDRSLSELDKNCIIPIPGLIPAGQYESSNSEYSPQSDWQVPHGPQPGPMTR